MGIFGCGLSSSWLLGISTIVSPIILPTAIGLTLGIFGGASLVAYKMPKDKILRYGPVLFGSLIGMIGFDVIGILASYFIGPNPLSELIFKTELYGGILLLAGLVAYLDQITKIWALKHLYIESSLSIFPGMNFVLSFNKVV